MTARTRIGAGKGRVLVCDDDAGVRGLIAEALGSKSILVETADRAMDAIQKIMRTRYQALILDLKMPGLGGLDTIPIIKRIDETLPIIVVTGHSSYETERTARAAGVFYYLVKPFPVEELWKAVSAATRHRKVAKNRADTGPPPSSSSRKSR
ncbi:MAG: response regulator [Candidatus Rokubacteria bacterium]|jgi:DNA-binding NtrC family response regulator|nr:response regulator [Candidatus Rokubacteria bacterium]